MMRLDLQQLIVTTPTDDGSETCLNVRETARRMAAEVLDEHEVAALLECVVELAGANQAALDDARMSGYEEGYEAGKKAEKTGDDD